MEHKFDQVARDPRFTFVGNTTVTASAAAPPHSSSVHVPLSEIAPYYTHVLFAYGASDARHLHVPGSAPGELRGVCAALDFVQWYNGHPDAHANGSMFRTLDGARLRHVGIVGAGNVALDVARMILRQSRFAPRDESLVHTDTPEPVLECLRSWAVEQVDLYVRRGAAQLAFTNKELREMLSLPHAPFRPLDSTHLDAAIAEAAAYSDVGHKRAMSRLLQQLKKGSKRVWDPSHAPRWGLHLLRSPAALHGDHDGVVKCAEWDVTEIDEGGAAKRTGARETSDVDLLVASVGYRSRPLAGAHAHLLLPFDAGRAVVPNIRSRVVDEEGAVQPGMYVSGWLANGPVGVIASTMMDAYAVADEMLADWLQTSGRARRTLCGSLGHREALAGVPAALRAQRTVSYDEWLQIDAAERQRGVPLGKEREKFLTVEDMLRVVGK